MSALKATQLKPARTEVAPALLWLDRLRAGRRHGRQLLPAKFRLLSHPPAIFLMSYTPQVPCCQYCTPCRITNMAVSQELDETQLGSTPTTQTRRNSKRKFNGIDIPHPRPDEDLDAPQVKRDRHFHCGHTNANYKRSDFPFGQMITLQIGHSDLTRFVVPKHFICEKSALVRTAIELSLERERNVKDTVYLPELCPTGFQVYLNWVYRDVIDFTLLEGDAAQADEGCEDELCGTARRGTRKSKLRKCIRLYEMAAKLEDSGLQQAILDHINKQEYHLQLDDTLIKDYLGRVRSVSSCLVQWMADVYIARVGGDHFSRDSALSVDFLFVVVERMKARCKSEELNNFPVWEGRYQYHEFEETS